MAENTKTHALLVPFPTEERGRCSTGRMFYVPMDATQNVSRFGSVHELWHHVNRPETSTFNPPSDASHLLTIC